MAEQLVKANLYLKWRRLVLSKQFLKFNTKKLSQVFAHKISNDENALKRPI